jgi:hypothetical protein
MQRRQQTLRAYCLNNFIAHPAAKKVRKEEGSKEKLLPFSLWTLN